MFDLQGQTGSKSNQMNNLSDYERHQLETLQRQNAHLDQERRGRIFIKLKFKLNPLLSILSYSK